MSAQNGITLIALIITIIIMLILAGVVINLVIGKNGIINIAKQAGKNYINAEDDERKKLEALYSSILVATNGDSQITISMEDLNSLISGKVREEVQKAVWGESVTPTGTIIAQMGKEAPSGYINCDGTTYNISEYKQLAEYIKNQFGSYNYFGGDGKASFAVPDLRGEFLRGTGTNSNANQGNGSDIGKHQNATEHLNIGAWNNEVGQVFLYTESSTINRLNPTNPDNQKIVNSGYRTINMSNELKPIMSRVQSYTSRPTNTSVLYCIKY